MPDFQKAREAFQSLKTQIGHPQNDPKMWDLALGLDAAVAGIEKSLTTIAQQQQDILRALRQLR